MHSFAHVVAFGAVLNGLVGVPIDLLMGQSMSAVISAVMAIIATAFLVVSKRRRKRRTD